MLHNVLVARRRNNFSQCVLCTNFLALYCMMVFIGENTGGGQLVASYKIKTRLFCSCYLQVVCAAQSLSRYKLALCILRDGFVCTYFLAFILTDGVYS